MGDSECCGVESGGGKLWRTEWSHARTNKQTNGRYQFRYLPDLRSIKLRISESKGWQAFNFALVYFLIDPFQRVLLLVWFCNTCHFLWMVIGLSNPSSKYTMYMIICKQMLMSASAMYMHTGLSCLINKDERLWECRRHWCLGHWCTEKQPNIPTWWNLRRPVCTGLIQVHLFPKDH